MVIRNCKSVSKLKTKSVLKCAEEADSETRRALLLESIRVHRQGEVAQF